MSLKEKFQKAGLTEKKVKMPEAKITDENGDKQTYKISKKSQKLVDQYQGRKGKVVNTPGAMVKGASFANKQEKHKARATPILDAITKRAGNAIASGNAGIIGGNAKNASVIANAIANSRKSAENVRTPIAATKGSVFVNKGYNPQNKSKSTEETKRLETAAQKANDFARKMQEKESALDTEGKEGLGKVGRAAYDLGKVGTQLAVDATVGLLVPGGGLASVGARSFGQGVMQAEDEGKTGKRAILYGAGTAAIETGTEKLTAAAKPLKAIYGAGVVESVLGKLTKKLNSSAKGRSALATIAKAASGEAAEEALADVLQVPLQRAVLENGAKFDADWAADTAYDALLGGVMGGVLGGGSVAVDRMQNRSTNSAKTMADAMQRARERNQKKSTGNAPPVMQRGAAQVTPTQQATVQNIPVQNINVNRQQNTAAQAVVDPTGQLRAEYEALQSGGGSGTMNENGGVGYGREGQVSESRGTAGRIGREMSERGETAGRGRNSGIQSNGNAIRNENAGQYGIQGNDGGINYGEEITARDTGRNVPENGQWGRVDGRGETTGAFSYDRPVVSRAEEYAGEYGIQVIPVSDEILAQRGHEAGTGFTNDGTVYMSENMPEETVRQFIAHEAVHTMKQNGFEPYLQFTQRTESLLNSSANTENVLANLMDHRGYQGTYDDLDLNQKFTVMDELNAALYGGYRSQPDKAISLARTIMNDPESYFSELSDIMEQYKARNDGRGTADQQMGNSVGSAKSAFPVERKVSQYRLNTLENTLTAEELEQIKNTDFSYQVLPDAQALDEARNRISYQERDADGNLHTVYDIEPEMDALHDSYMWSEDDVVTAGMIANQLKNRAYENGDWSEYNKWEKEIQTHATKLGQALRSFRLYQTDGDAVTAKTADILKDTNLPEEEKNALQSEVQSHIDAIERAGDDKASLIDQIESIARRRGTTKRGLTGVLFGKNRGLSKTVRKYLESMDYDTLKSKAFMSAQNIAADHTTRSLGEKVKTIQVMNQLGNLITFERNLTGNFAFGIQDATSDSMAAALDIVLSKFTGTRSQEFNAYFLNKGQREAATKAMQNAVVDISLDIDEISENRYGLTSGRTFKMNKGPFTRFLSTVEKYLSYSLTASDEYFKGGARGGVEQGLRSLYESGKLNIPSDQLTIDGTPNADVEKYIRDKAEEKARYVTFQDDSTLANVSQMLHDAANKVGFGKTKGYAGKDTHAFGLGDMLMPYAKVPGNLASRALEYSPAGAIKGAYEIFNTMIDARKGSLDINQQRKAVQDVARGVNGTMLWAAFAALAAKGLLQNADDQDDEDVAALNAAEGLSGTQINLDACARYLNGESSEWQYGDTLVGISFLEPLNAAMAAGTMLANDYAVEAGAAEMAKDSADKIVESVFSIPSMQTLNEFYTGISYGNGASETIEKAVTSSIAGSITPALVRQTAKAQDNNYRDTYSSENTVAQAIDKVKQNVPGLREQLPKKLDNFGREKTYTDNQTLNVVNALIAPGSINTYKQSGLSKRLEDLGDPTLYPSRSAPKSVSVDNEDIELDYKQQQKFQKIRGGKAYTTMNAMAKTDIYKNASKEEKIELLSECNSYASALAKDKVVKKYELSTKYQNASKAADPAQWLAEAYVYGTVDGDIDQNAKAAVEQYGMNLERYREIKKTMGEFRADKDANGESIDGTCKTKVINYLKQQGLTSEQYYFLYHSKYKK